MNQRLNPSTPRTATGSLLGGIGRPQRVATSETIDEKIAAQCVEAKRVEPEDSPAAYANGEILTLLNNNLDSIHDIQVAFSTHLERISPILGLNRPEPPTNSLNEPVHPAMSSSIGDRLAHQNMLLAQLLGNIIQATELVAL